MSTTEARAAISALCAAIDEGDDSALPVLADALDDAGDPRAAGLRGLRYRPRQYSHDVITNPWAYWSLQRYDGDPEYCLPPETFARLSGLPAGLTSLGYPTRSAAYLALAAALAAT